MKPRSVPAHHKPYPELVEQAPNSTPYWIIDTSGKPWLPTNGMTSLEERKLLVPLEEGARSVARHELAHVKWSPERLPKVDFDARVLMAVEDARLNLGLLSIGLPVELTDPERVHVARLSREDLATRDAFAFVLRALAAQGTNAERVVLREVLTYPPEIQELVERHVRGVRNRLLRGRRQRSAPVASFELVLRLAEELTGDLERELGALGLPKGLPFPLQLAGAGCCLGFGHRHGSAAARGDARALARDENRSGGATTSGAMKIVVAALDHACPQPRGGRRGRSRATAEGSLPLHPYRWPIDAAIFRRTPRRRGGTVLIDTSGSMSLDAAGVDQILLASTGAALIAIYSGAEQAGELRIVARDGRRADAKDLVPFGRGNIIDEPALAWLARQAEPRLWISDGGVTGIGDTTSAALQHRCQEICQGGSIRRVRTLEEAAACLARGGRHAGVA